jgi:hypothetical protein
MGPLQSWFCHEHGTICSPLMGPLDWLGCQLWDHPGVAWTELTAAGARELAAALVECGRCLRRRSVTRARRLALLRLVDGRRFLVVLSEAATRVAPAPPVPQGLRRRHPLSCLPHHRQDTLGELLGEHLDAIDVSRAGKTLARTILLPADPGQLLTAPNSWTVSSIARHGPTPDNAYRVLRSTR